ncbi:hypothetical protein EGT50_07285 [Rhodococcus xishaensis]|uniref:Uncharacterized protein n=1 Tax=Rhodococcus xishaensis TaxID=2487364 RepID=A0A438AZW8_9NOCA|nr:hypothetical protein EGT50_07285 [Rhodococcus xishaensis]
MRYHTSPAVQCFTDRCGLFTHRLCLAAFALVRASQVSSDRLWTALRATKDDRPGRIIRKRLRLNN